MSNQPALDVFLETVAASLRPNSKVLLGVSGGIDSVALLHACWLLRESLNLHLEIAHVDHRLRPDSRCDAEFVQDLAKKYAVTCHTHECEKIGEGQNVEAWGREQRYTFFARTLELRLLDFSVTAHNANDCAETLLMRLLSNKEANSISAWDEKRKLLRPLLTLSRKDIQGFAQQHKLNWREDSSNQDLSFLRNRVRHKLIPFLEQEFSGNILDILVARAAALAEDQNALNLILSEVLQNLSTLAFGSKQWLTQFRQELLKIPASLHGRLVMLSLRPVIKFNLGREHCQRVLDVINQKSTAVELPGGCKFRRKNAEIVIE